MEIRADEISRIIREQIKDYGKKVEVTETGTVLSQADGVARIYGLAGAAAGELLEFPHGVRGLVLEEDNVGAAVMGMFEHIREGTSAMRCSGASWTAWAPPSTVAGRSRRRRCARSRSRPPAS